MVGTDKQKTWKDLTIFEDAEVFETDPELLHDTPSRRDGVDEETECMLRIYGCELIQECGILLRCNQTAMATGQIIFHRFYFRESMKRYDVRTVAKASLLLSTKIEEQPHSASDILNVFHASQQARRGAKVIPLEQGTTRYYELKQELFDAELKILRELGFTIHAEHAHKFVLYYIRILYDQSEFRRDLAQRAWNYANDSYRTMLCVRYRPNVLACAAIFLAARDLGIPLPKGWWTLFEASETDVLTVCSGILGLYEMPKALFINVNAAKKELPTPPPPPVPAPESKDEEMEDAKEAKESSSQKGKGKRGSSSSRDGSVERPEDKDLERGSKEERERKLQLLEKLEESLMTKGKGDRDRSRSRERGGRVGRDMGRSGRDSELDRDMDRDRDRRRPRSRSPPRRKGPPSRSPRRSRSPPRRSDYNKNGPPRRGRSRSRSPPDRRDRDRGNARGANRDRDRDNGDRERVRGGFPSGSGSGGGRGDQGNGVVDSKSKASRDRDRAEDSRKTTRDRDDSGRGSRSPVAKNSPAARKGINGERESEERGRGNKDTQKSNVEAEGNGGDGDEKKSMKSGMDVLQSQREWASKKTKDGQANEKERDKVDGEGGKRSHDGDGHHQMEEEGRALQRLSVAERQKRRAAKFGLPAEDHETEAATKGLDSDQIRRSDNHKDEDDTTEGPLAGKEPERKKFKVRIGQRDDLEKKA